MKIFCDRSCLQLPLYCFKSVTAEAANDNTKLTHSHCLCIAGAAVIDRKKEDGSFSVLYAPKQRRQRGIVLNASMTPMKLARFALESLLQSLTLIKRLKKRNFPSFSGY